MSRILTAVRPFHPYRRYNLRPKSTVNPNEDGVYSGPQEIVSKGDHLTLTYGDSEASTTRATLKCDSNGNLVSSAPIVSASGTEVFANVNVTTALTLGTVPTTSTYTPTQAIIQGANGDTPGFLVGTNSSGTGIFKVQSTAAGHGKVIVGDSSAERITFDTSTGLSTMQKVTATSTAANNSIITAKSYTNANVIVDVKELTGGHGNVAVYSHDRSKVIALTGQTGSVTATSASDVSRWKRTAAGTVSIAVANQPDGDVVTLGETAGNAGEIKTYSGATLINTLDASGVVSTELLKVAGTGDRRVHVESTNALNAAYMRLKNPSWEWDLVLDGAAGSVPGAISFQDNGSGYVRPFHISATGVKIGGTSNATMAVYDQLYRSNVTFASSALADETKSTDVCTLQLKCVRVGQQVTICLDNGPDDTFDLTTDGAGYLKMKQVDVVAFAAAGSGRFLPNVNVFVPIVAYPGNGAATACLMVIFTTGDIYLYGNTAGGNFPAGVSLVRFLSTQYIKDSGY